MHAIRSSVLPGLGRNSAITILPIVAPACLILKTATIAQWPSYVEFDAMSS